MMHFTHQLDQTVFHLLEEIHLDSRKTNINHIYTQDFTCVPVSCNPTHMYIFLGEVSFSHSGKSVLLVAVYIQRRIQDFNVMVVLNSQFFFAYWVQD